MHRIYKVTMDSDPWSLSNFCKKKTANINQILRPKTYPFINVLNGVSRSHKTANILFSFDYGHRSQVESRPT